MFKNTYRDKTVMVTGNTGFKGSWLTLWLMDLGAKVIGVSDGIPTQPSMFEILGLKNEITHHFADVNDSETMQNLVAKYKPDFLFHLAAQPIVSSSYKEPLKTFQTNIIGTANVLEALRISNHRCDAVFITSDKCYENVEWTWGYRENDRLGGKDPYSASKAGAEIIIYSYHNSFFSKTDSLVRLVSVRAGNVIGGGDWAESRIIPDCVRAWAKHEAVVIRRPQATRPWQHVLEPISGYLTAGQSLNEQMILNGESFNFGPPADQTFTVQQTLEAIAENWSFKDNYDRVTIQEDKSFHEAGLLKLNCDKALHKLQWKPVLNFKEATRFTAQWYSHYYNQGSDRLREFTLAQIESYTGSAKKMNIAWALQ